MIAALVYAKLAPLHSARLEATYALGQAKHYQLIGIEIADSQADYHWPRLSQQTSSAWRRTLFPGDDYWALSYRRIRQALHQALDDMMPDVVVLPGWGFRESLAGLGWCLRRGIPRVVISDSQSIDTRQTLGKLWLKRFLIHQFQVGFAGGKPHLRYLANLGLPQERCVIGCDVVDNAFFTCESQRWRERLQKRNGVMVLLSCLRLLPRKNILGVLDVLAHRAQEWTWMLAGDGPQRLEIEQRITELGLQDRVCLLGHVDYFELPSLYAQADAYLQPSLSEPWGLAVNEAMACGLPVVVSNRCGCQEDLVQEGVNGFTFDPTQPESLAGVLERLLACKNHWGEMGHASQEIIACWGLECFAQNFWRACDIAVQAVSGGPGARAINKAMGLVL